MGRGLENVDQGILYHLQRDARNTTTQEIAETVGTSASTVRNRIEALEEDGIIKGYRPEIDYEAANLPLCVQFVCTAPPVERAEYVQQVLDVQGAIDVRETLVGRQNIYVDAVGTSTGNITRVTDVLHEMGLTVESAEMMRKRYTQPFNHFHFRDDIPEETQER